MSKSSPTQNVGEAARTKAVAAHEAIEQPPLARGRRHAQDETEHGRSDHATPMRASELAAREAMTSATGAL